MPRNQDQEMWNDEKTMNLYFNVDYNGQNGNKDDVVNIASATLRLYKLPQDGNATGPVENCKDVQYLSDDDKQIRVSVYWYSKLKKHKGSFRAETRQNARGVVIILFSFAPFRS